MHVENELMEFVTAREQEYQVVIEEYEEEVSKPSPTDLTNTPPAQGKLRCITLILNNHLIYMCDVNLRYRIYIKTTCIDKPTYEFY